MARKTAAPPPYVTLTLRNPSPYGRRGFVIRQWQPVTKELGVRARSARVAREVTPGDPRTALVPLAAQVDRLDPRDRFHDQLVFKLDRAIPAGDEHYRSISGKVQITAADANEPPAGATVERFYTGVKLRNQHLEVWLNTAANKHRSDDLFYGGAVTSVVLQNQEFTGRRYDIEALDAITARGGAFPPHPEARAMQIDKVHLVRPPWDDRRSVDFFPFKEPWRIVATSSGPVRALVTIMSAPFEFRSREFEGPDRVFRCNVYRAVSLYDDADWIADEIWVKARELSSGKSQRLWFTARYFMMVHFTDEKWTFRYPDHPGWFAIDQKGDPWLGYAFATDAMSGAIWNPPLDYRDPETEVRAYSWDLGTTRTAHCFHKFRCKTDPLQMGHEAGWMWYDLAFKRIRATLAGEK
jgi:hypothetical protein